MSATSSLAVMTPAAPRTRRSSATASSFAVFRPVKKRWAPSLANALAVSPAIADVPPIMSTLIGAHQAAVTRRQKEEENFGSTCDANDSHSGKKRRKLAALMRASLAG